jgi:hypothetical protein
MHMPVVKFVACLEGYAYLILNENPGFFIDGLMCVNRILKEILYAIH